MFKQDCFDAVKNYALQALPELVAAGMDGIFLDGMITFEEGCKAGQVDINCTAADCHGTPTNVSEWGPRCKSMRNLPLLVI